MQQKRISQFILFLIVCASLLATVTVNASLPLPPRFSANAYASDYAVGQADVMFPLVGDPAHNFYVDPNLAYASDSQGYADLGVGYRWIKSKAAILGWYVFGGYARIDNNARLWVANPGIEALGSRWDAHLNGYLAMGDRNVQVGNILSFSHFTGHDVIDNDFQLLQHAGNGADVKLGYQLFPRVPLKAYVGSYFFAPAQTNKLWGGAAGLEYWLDSYIKVFASYTYDTYRHSTGALGLGIEFGGTRDGHRSDPTLEERMTDPVERYLAALSKNQAIPDRISQVFNSEVITETNIAFFSQTGGPNNGGIGLTLANCTFENPCGPSDLTDASAITLDTLLPNTEMYFNGGSYNALNVLGGTNAVTLQPGQSVQSRSADYTQPAAGGARSTFNGAFVLNSNNTLENIILLSTPATATGASGGRGVYVLPATGATNILVTGSQIGSPANPFQFGIVLYNVNNGLIQNSNIYASSPGYTAGAFISSSGVTILNSSITATNSTANTFRTDAVEVADTSVVTIMDSTLTVTGITDTSTNGIYFSLAGATGNIVNASNLQISATNTGGGTASAVMNLDSGNSAIINNSGLAATASPGTASISTGPSIQIANSTCFLNGGSVICP